MCKILIFESSAGWLCHHLGSDNLHSILPSWHLPTARQSRHSVKLVNLTSPLTTFAKTMQQHVRLIKNLLNSSDFNQRPFQTIIVTRLPLWTSGPWRGEARGRPPAPASLLRSGVWSMVGRNNKTLSTTVTCPRAAPCPPVLLPHCCKDETKYLNSRRRSVNSC